MRAIKKTTRVHGPVWPNLFLRYPSVANLKVNPLLSNFYYLRFINYPITTRERPFCAFFGLPSTAFHNVLSAILKTSLCSFNFFGKREKYSTYSPHFSRNLVMLSVITIKLNIAFFFLLYPIKSLHYSCVKISPLLLTCYPLLLLQPYYRSSLLYGFC